MHCNVNGFKAKIGKENAEYNCIGTKTTLSRSREMNVV